MRKIVFAVLSVLIFLSFGCGSEGGSRNSGPEFTYNAQGYPIVSGTYTGSLGKLTNNCGAAEVAPQILSNATVSQNGNNVVIQAITDFGYQAFDAIGFTVVEESEMVGTMLKDARFSSTRGLTLHHATIGNLYVNYAMNGKFTPSGYSGTLGYTAFDDFGSSCTYQGNFTGDKL